MTETDWLKVVDPATGEVAREVRCDTDSALDAKLEAARRAQRAWRSRPVSERVRELSSFLAYFREAKESVALDVSREMGKPLREARGEVEVLLARSECMLSLAEKALAPETLSEKAGIERRIEHAPLGLVLDIAAWNYPLIVPGNVVLPALLAGNAVVLKHSPKTPAAGEHFEKALARLSDPALFAHVVLPDSRAGGLVSDARIDHVAFTGSVRTGRRVYETAASHLAGVGLELGGKDPAYVAEDADLDFAAANLVEGACFNAGQSCCAVERVYVHERVWARFLERALRAMAELRIGSPQDEHTTLGPLVDEAARARVEAQVADALERGARLLSGGRGLRAQVGFFHEATLLADCPDEALVMREETFGPVLPARSVRNDEEALACMNDSPYGLTASIWTTDPARAEHFARELEAGTVYQNRCDYLDPNQPWTGWKQSGLGSTLSRYGFLGLTRRKSIHLRRAAPGPTPARNSPAGDAVS
jgi:acyl-CoA reductase-like NAD-dependent aldehyde dehydrogenase